MISAILLGDGLSRKHLWQVQKLKGKPILLHSIENLQNSSVDEIILVVGKDYHVILNKIKFSSKKVRLIMNRRYDRGLSSYLRAGMPLISPASEGVFVVRGEYPMVKSSLLDRMVEYFKQNQPGVLIPTYQNEQGQPVLYKSDHFKHLKMLTGDDIGASIIAKYGRDASKIEAKNPGVIMGLDRLVEMEELDTEEINREEAHAAALDLHEKKELPIIEMEPKTREIDTAAKGSKDLKDVSPVKTGGTPMDKITIEELTKSVKEERKTEMGKTPPDLSLKMLNDLLGQKERKSISPQKSKDDRIDRGKTNKTKGGHPSGKGEK